MARTEHHTKKDHEELKKEIADELRQEGRRRRRRGCVIYLIFLAVIFGIPLLWAGSVLARTGIVDVPILSSMLYEPVSPSRVIAPLVGYSSDDILTTFGARASYDFSTGTIEIPISEQELTTLVSGAFAQSAESSSYPLIASQLAIEERYVEFYAEIERNDGQRIPVRVHMIPTARDNLLDLQFNTVVVGGYEVPDVLVDVVMSLVGGSIFDASTEISRTFGELKSVQLERGEVRVIFLPDQTSR